MFVGRARSLPNNGAPEMCFTRVGSYHSCEHYTILERLARDKHSNLLQKFITYNCKIFIAFAPGRKG
jgi:hypothetical protein